MSANSTTLRISSGGKRLTAAKHEEDAEGTPVKDGKRNSSTVRLPGKDSQKLKKEEADEEEADEDEFHWWENEDEVDHGDGVRWKSLSHEGVFFAPAYQPHGIPILYEGKPFPLRPEEEEVATMFAVLRNSDYYKNEVFRANFFAAWKEILDRRPEGKQVRRLEYCNFDAIWEWHQRERDIKLNLPREEKKRRREELAKQVEPFRFCVWDGRKEPVANFRVEPPGLFRGRGKHPLQGCLKRRIEAEDITLNLSEDAVVPAPPAGHKWREVVHRPEAMWLCMWKDTVTGNFKYVMPGVSSSIKGMLDKRKFEKARKLKGIIDSIRASYLADLHNKESLMMRQRATAMYFIDRLALRVGNEKGEDEADTVGCCSLRCEHLTLKEPNHITFDFLGKDSVRYYNTVEVDRDVFLVVRELMKGKHREDEIFDQLTPTQLNTHLKSFMPELSAKVFRTYNASICLQNHFFEHPVDPSWTVPDKLAYFTEANTKVAILCNHQKGVSKNHSQQVVQLEAKMKQLCELRDRVLMAIKIAETGSMHEVEVTKPNKSKAMKKEETIITAENWSAAKAFWLAEEDRVQWSWLEEHGTEEDRAQYRSQRATDAASPTPASTASSARKRARSETPRAPIASNKRSAAKQAKKVEESSSDDDITIGALRSKSAGAVTSRATKSQQKEVKGSKCKQVKVEDEASSSEEETLAELLKKSRRR